MSRVLNVVAVLAGFSALILHAEPSRIPHGTVDLIPAVSSIEPGSAFQVGLLFRLEPGWHIYWKNPGDSGQPPRLKWELPAGLTAGEIEWPAPKRLPVGPLLDYGYEGEVLLPITFEASPDLPVNSSQNLNANLRVLVCRETCMPGKAALTLTLPVRKGAPRIMAENARLFASANASKPKAVPPGWEISAKETSSSILLSVAGAPQEAKVSFIPAHPNQIENAAPQASSRESQGLALSLRRSPNASGNQSLFDGLLLTEQAGVTSAYTISAQLAHAPDVLSGGRRREPRPRKA